MSGLDERQARRAVPAAVVSSTWDMQDPVGSATRHLDPIIYVASIHFDSNVRNALGCIESGGKAEGHTWHGNDETWHAVRSGAMYPSPFFGPVLCWKSRRRRAN